MYTYTYLYITCVRISHDHTHIRCTSNWASFFVAWGEDDPRPPLIPVAFGEIPLPMSRCPSVGVLLLNRRRRFTTKNKLGGWCQVWPKKHPNGENHFSGSAVSGRPLRDLVNKFSLYIHKRISILLPGHAEHKDLRRQKNKSKDD